jgi:hypothetical protein
MDPSIEDYIRENRTRYTKEAIRAQLVAAGHPAADVDAAWDRVGGGSAAAAPVGWRPRWREFLVLLVLGAIGAALVWSGQPYSAGGVAPIAYAIVLSIGFGAAKLISITIDRGAIDQAALWMAVIAVAAALFAAINQFSPIFLVAAGAIAVLAVGLFVLKDRNPGAAGMVGAALPVVVWLLVTGTCYAPLLSRPAGA